MTAFIVAQVLDGALTYVGVSLYGVQIEANPVLTWYMVAIGPAAALVGAKAFAVGCGYVLHQRSRHRVLGLLTIVYLLATVTPWSQVLWP